LKGLLSSFKEPLVQILKNKLGENEGKRGRSLRQAVKISIRIRGRSFGTPEKN
jgi:hypothetical protein